MAETLRHQIRADSSASPHLNGKVERSHQTDLAEFYATADLTAPTLPEQLALWQHAYNWDRPHSSLGGKTPVDRVCELADRTPLHEEVDVLVAIRVIREIRVCFLSRSA